MGTELYCPVKKIADSIQDNKEPLKHLFLEIEDPIKKDKNINYLSIYNNCLHNSIIHDIVHIDNTCNLSYIAQSKKWTKYDLITVFCHWSNERLTADQFGIIELFRIQSKYKYPLIDTLQALIKDNGAVFLLACDTYNNRECTAKQIADILQRDVYGFDRTVTISLDSPEPETDFWNILTVKNSKLMPNKKEFKSVTIPFITIYFLILMTLTGNDLPKSLPVLGVQATLALYFRNKRDKEATIKWVEKKTLSKIDYKITITWPIKKAEPRK